MEKMETDSKIRINLQNHIDACKLLLENLSFQLAYNEALKLIVTSLKSGGRIYIIGNGGSASDAAHIAAELVCKLKDFRPSIPAEALTTDMATITAIGNDFGYDQIFSRQVEAKVTKNDILLALTTSGNSENVYKALEYGKGTSILLTGNGGGKCAKLANVVLNVGNGTAGDIQQLHEIVYHTLVEEIEQSLYDDSN